ncbi:hypothetical protein L3X38_035730 [Prunus dulcis]|uniref:Uncharacterized protein n=1 Tax=Prunus dulcis TaxID=3755 RepID=A0AAD4VMJ5_PRUDU|nr:hypothetical protein L3X38_035730 [Prunus dulcis]
MSVMKERDDETCGSQSSKTSEAPPMRFLFCEVLHGSLLKVRCRLIEALTARLPYIVKDYLKSVASRISPQTSFLFL